MLHEKTLGSGKNCSLTNSACITKGISKDPNADITQ